MATIAIDATYTVDPMPTGLAVYSRHLIGALATLHNTHRYLLCFRLSRFRQRGEFSRYVPAGTPRGPQFAVRWYQEPLTFWLPWQTKLFHSLGQRPPAFRFEREVVSVQDLFPLTEVNYSSPDFRRKFSQLLIDAVKRSVRVIAPSKYTADELVTHTGVAREKICVIPHGVHFPTTNMAWEQRTKERARLVGEGRHMILSVGVVQNRKNTMNSILALANLPERYRLVIAGGSGYGSELVHDFIRKSDLASRVIVLGYVEPERLPVLYQSADVFLFPSLGEGFGFPVLEAMAHGLPVVASKVTSLPEVGGDAAVYVDPYNPSDIAEKVALVTEDSKLRGLLIERGLTRARIFSWRRAAEATLAVYEEVLNL